jgi:serine/threonine-protein kinase
MLSGQLRDPVLGRDLLVGTLFGVAAAFFEHLRPFAETLLGKSPMRPFGLGTTYPLEGVRGCLASVLYYAVGSLSSALLIFFVFFVVRLVLRKNWLAALVASLLLCIPSFGAPNPAIDLFFSLPIALGFLLVVHRFGLLTMAAMYFANQLTDYMPYSTPLNAWYMEGGLTAFVAILIIGLYGFHISRAGKSVFAKDFLER